MPKCTIEQIQLELVRLKAGGFRCAVVYLEAELAKRKASQKNTGRAITKDSKLHEQWRKASAKRREKLKAKTEEVDTDFDFGT